jgi:histidinol-phosphate aminotransferase
MDHPLRHHGDVDALPGLLDFAVNVQGSGPAAERAEQAERLAAVPGVTVLPGTAPYLLLRLPDGHGERVRTALREAGIAVRRGDTFPGLGPAHVRVAVRPAAQVTRLVTALAETLAAAAA